nr:hypothetical protein GCM10017611_79670 [Rhodococcus wratislaviensis]
MREPDGAEGRRFLDKDDDESQIVYPAPTEFLGRRGTEKALLSCLHKEILGNATCGTPFVEMGFGFGL